MQQSNARESLGQEVGVLELSRSHTRTRRRRRKRSWRASWADLLSVLLDCGTVSISPALFAGFLSCYKGDMAGL